nr:hypothetical protein [Candidatus Sigynarchaeota archaeon]
MNRPKPLKTRIKIRMGAKIRMPHPGSKRDMFGVRVGKSSPIGTSKFRAVFRRK